MTPTHRAAVEAIGTAAMANLLDRRGIKNELQACKHDDAEVWQEIIENTGQDALTALTTLHPGIGAVLRGEAVVVPREATKFLEDYFAPWGSWKTVWWEGVSGDKEFNDTNALAVFRTILAASPYAPTAGGGA